MKKVSFIVVFLCQFLMGSCNNLDSRNSGDKTSFDTSNIVTYRKFRRNFDVKLIDHFPSAIITDTCYKLTSKTDKQKNDVGLLLYNYVVNKRTIDSIEENLKRKSILAKYVSSDSCLLVVNRFETRETSENGTTPEIKDTAQINRDCYERRYPVPNFIECKYSTKGSATKLDSTFVIYVLEARSGKFFPKYDLKPSPQMPVKWKNGYSKGIAISEQRKTVIYWGILW
jgi:hypothetical protein